MHPRGPTTNVLRFVVPLLAQRLGGQLVERFVTDNPRRALEGAGRLEQPRLL